MRLLAICLQAAAKLGEAAEGAGSSYPDSIVQASLACAAHCALVSSPGQRGCAAARHLALLAAARFNELGANSALLPLCLLAGAADCGI